VRQRISQYPTRKAGPTGGPGVDYQTLIDIVK